MDRVAEESTSSLEEDMSMDSGSKRSPGSRRGLTHLQGPDSGSDVAAPQPHANSLDHNRFQHARERESFDVMWLQGFKGVQGRAQLDRLRCTHRTHKAINIVIIVGSLQRYCAPAESASNQGGSPSAAESGRAEKPARRGSGRALQAVFESRAANLDSMQDFE
eukprot:scaffold48136_cov42-Prasinocladus_malaysianus.AAC.1